MKLDSLKITALANKSLDRAERIWNEVGHEFEKRAAAFAALNEAMESQIPGYAWVEDGKPKVDEFIAMVVDLRGSKNHLMCAISDAKVSELQRIFYETSALLPAMAQVIEDRGGKTTEYLGDGVLALFRVEDPETDSIYASYNAAKDCMSAVSEILNPILKDRYGLPPLHIGVGLGRSKAIVTIVGYSGFSQPKAFGACVFRATKLSGNGDLICIDKPLKISWPTKKGGILDFRPMRTEGFEGYVVERNSKAGGDE